MEPIINTAIKSALEKCTFNPTSLDEAIHFVIGYLGHEDQVLADLLTQLIAKTK